MLDPVLLPVLLVVLCTPALRALPELVSRLGFLGGRDALGVLLSFGMSFGMSFEPREGGEGDTFTEEGESGVDLLVLEVRISTRRRLEEEEETGARLGVLLFGVLVDELEDEY